MRKGTLDTTNMIAIDIGASIHDEQMIEITREVALPTALVRLHTFAPYLPTTDFEFLGLDETRAARHLCS
jgi:hypothetical protein